MSRFLVKYRKAIFALMTILVVLSSMAVPHINVITDMTRYLPDDYPMKQGINVLEQQLPAVEEQMSQYGSVFANGNDLMPEELPRTLAIGVGLLFVVLFLMCSSMMEVLLFLVTTVFAVILNMGTNALSPGVSMMTNMLAPVLQMVLSMDYCIILMNRYRQEKLLGKAPEEALQGAIQTASSSIMSSAFTTIVSLLMLVFIKLKIGADLGVVLSKGVAFSFICTFTVLPALILWGDRAVEATRKKIPVFPSAPFARFQYKFRWPLLVLFICLFGVFFHLQKQTPLSFSANWNSKGVAAEQDRDNAALLLYSNSLEEAVPELLDTIGNLPHVLKTFSYPSLVKRPRTAGQMEDLFREVAPERASALSGEMLPMVYYARFRPQRTERLSFDELLERVDELQARGLVPEGFDKSELIPPMPVEEPVLPGGNEAVQDIPAEPQDTPAAPADTLSRSAERLPADTLSTAADTLSVSADTLAASVSAGPGVTYEEITQEYTAAELARFMGLDRHQLTLLYRMAGRGNQTMTPVEVITYLREKILPNKRYASFLSKDMRKDVATYGALVDSLLAAGPAPVPVAADSVLLAAVSAPADSLTAIAASTDTLAGIPAAVPADSARTAAAFVEPEAPPTPLEVLANMAFSSRRYSSARIYSALHAAGIDVSQEQLDLLFLYSGAREGGDPDWKMSLEELLNFVADTLFVDPALSGFLPDSVRTLVTGVRENLDTAIGQIYGPDYSVATVISTYPPESDSTSAFILQLRKLADEALPGTHYWIGGSEMYQELQEGFPQELLLLTLLTVLAIFVIVAINFHSVFIPIPLIMTILSGVYVNVWASGLGGNTMYYLSYLIIQGILMGATIDYTILFTHYYLEARKEFEVADSLTEAFKGSSHTILTSGLILTIVPYMMAFTMSDPMIASILRCLGTGSLSVVLLLLFVLPGVIAALDPLFNRRKARK